MSQAVVERVLAHVAANVPRGETCCVWQQTCDQMTVPEMRELVVRARRESGVTICLHIGDRERYGAYQELRAGRVAPKEDAM